MRGFVNASAGRRWVAPIRSVRSLVLVYSCRPVLPRNAVLLRRRSPGNVPLDIVPIDLTPMASPLISFLADPTLESMRDAAAGVVAAARAPSTVVVLLAERGAPDLTELSQVLRGVPAPACGAMFPAVIHDGVVSDRGAVVLALESSRPPRLLTGIGAEGFELELSGSGTEGALVLVDGLTPRPAHFLAELYRCRGVGTHFFGGGAGSASLRPMPVLFTPEGVFQDAALLVEFEGSCTLGVAHGFELVKGPLLTTRTDGCVVEEINWRPAFDVYAEVLSDYCGVTVTRQDFGSTAQAFPLGLARENGDPVLRDPIALTDDGGLVCVGEVPEHASFGIYRGEPGTLTAAAGRAVDAGVGPGNAKIGFVADCISRSILLGDRFEEELEAIRSRFAVGLPGAPVIGALTLGEVSSVGDRYLEFLNKTCVVAALGDREPA